MKRGKIICETLKGIRQEIATANEIDYSPAKCDHEGDCAGTCPCCESEMRWLESQLRLRRSLGKAVTIAGLSLGVASLASCSTSGNQGHNSSVRGKYITDTTKTVCDSIRSASDTVRAEVQASPNDEKNTTPTITELRPVGMVDMELLDSLENESSQSALDTSTENDSTDSK